MSVLRQPSFVVIPVGGDDTVSRDEVVAEMRGRLTVGSIQPVLYVIEEDWMVLRIAQHIQDRHIKAAAPTAAASKGGS